MGEDTARAVGTGDVVSVGGKDYHISPCSIRSLHLLQREAVRYYKRNVMEAYRDNVDLITDSETERKQMLEAKLAEVSRLDIDDLPKQVAYDVSRIDLDNEDVLAVLRREFTELPKGKRRLRALLSVVCDRGLVDEEQIKQWGGRSQKVAYDEWWISGCYDGIMALVWASLLPKHPNITREEVRYWPTVPLIEAAKMAEAITLPAVGNM